MKTKRWIPLLLCLVFCIGLLPALAFADGDRYLEINEANFPDDIFRNLIINGLDVSGDATTGYYMTKEQVNEVTQIYVTYRGIQSLVGIEHFPALTTLACNDNMLTSLDVSKNTALGKLICYNNLLSELDVSKNTALWQLACDNNLLTHLDVTKNTMLWSLICNNNLLTSLDLSGNSALLHLTCSHNQLTKLDLSKNTALEWLYCDNNQLVTLDVSNCPALVWLYCMNNLLPALDVSQNAILEDLCCFSNPLKVLDVSKNPSLINLTCGDNLLTSLDVSKNTALASLSCYGNQLTSLYLTPTLEVLNCDNNLLTALDLSKNSVLTELRCSGNQLTALDVSLHVKLTSLHCGDNPIRKLNVSKNTALTELWCNGDQLTELDVSNNTAIQELKCYNNQLTQLDVSKLTGLRLLICDENQLSALDLSSNKELMGLHCQNNQLTTLDVSKNTWLGELMCSKNKLTALDLSANTELQYLECYSNQLPMLDLRANTKLSHLDISQEIKDQVLDHVNGGYQFDLSKLIPLIYMANVTVSGDADLNKDTGIVSFSKKVDSFAYQYDTGRGAMDVTITFGNGGSDPTPEPTATPAPTPTPAPNALTIVQQPKDVKVKSGSKAKFTVKAKEKNVTYQWFSKAPKGDWTLMKGETQNKLTVAASGANNGYQYRCLVKNREGGQAYSRAAKLTVTLQPPVIKTQPKDLNVKSGAKAKFSVKASGKNISYQWYERFDAKSEWKLMKGETRNTLQVVASKATDGHQYYCHLKNTDGEADSKTAKLMVKTEAPTIKTQPKSVTVKSGKKAKFSVKASGKNLKYQWYERANADAEWTAVNGGTKNSLSVETSKAKNGCQYYCKVTNPDGAVNSAVVTLTVTPEAPVIKTQPKDVKVKAGAKAKFKVKASPKNVTYQWYYRENENAEWKLIKGATKAEYSFVASAEMFGWQFRCLARNDDGQAWSKVATLLQK